MEQPVEIFCCAAEADQPFLQQLCAHLTPLQEQGIIKIWDRSQIKPGEKMNDAILQHLSSTRIFLLLISANFLQDTVYCDPIMRTAREKHSRQEAYTIPIIVRPVKQNIH